MNKTFLVIFLGLVMIGLTYGMSSSYALPQNLPDVVQIHAPPFKAKIIDANGWRAVIMPLLTTTNSPDNYVSGTTFPGVAVLLLPRTDIPEEFVAVCTGSLIAQDFILTAAHCVTNDAGELVLKAGGLARFGSSIGDFSHSLSIKEGATQVHPLWNGDVGMGRDVAVLKLNSPGSANLGLTIYKLDSNASDDLDDPFQTKVGFGRTGTLDKGVDDAFDIGIKRNGQNTYDDFIDTLFVEVLHQTPGDDFISESVFLYDSDNGEPGNDAFGFFLGNVNSELIDFVGLGDDEVNSAGGDSGGPSFNSDGKITGITSFGMVLGGSRGLPTPDCDLNKIRGINIPDSSCGEFSGDMRVSQYLSFISGAIGGPDTTRPTPTITSAQGASGTSTDAATINFTVEFVEDVTRFDISDLVVTGIPDSFSPVASNFETTDASTYTFDVVPTTDGTVVINIAANAAQDLSSNESNSATEFTITSDITTPDPPASVTVSSILPISMAKGKTIPVTITGTGFFDGASVTFENGCGPSPSASSIVVESTTTITAEITTKNGGPNKNCAFEVRVTNSGGSTGAGSQFTVEGN